MYVPRFNLGAGFRGKRRSCSLNSSGLPLLLLGMSLIQPIFAQAPLRAEDPTSGQPARPVVNGSAQLASHYADTTKLRLAFALKPPKLDEERQFISQLNDKKSPQFHKFLTADQWNARFAPSVHDEQAVVDWATSQGMTITHRYANRLLVDVEAPVSVIENSLNVKLNNYNFGKKTFFSNDKAPTLRSDLNSVVWAVLGLNSWEQERPVSKRAVPSRPAYLPGPSLAVGATSHNDADPAAAAAFKARVNSHSVSPNITGGAYDPTDIYSSEAYDTNALYGQGHCCNPLNNPGQTPPETSIAIATFQAQDLSDIAGFHNQYPYLAYNIQLYDIDGTPASGDGEGTMDAEWSTAMSNSFGSYVNTSKIYVYQGANYMNNTITDVYSHMLDDGNARIFSTSWACAEEQSVPGETDSDCYAGTMNARDAIFASMVGQGWTLVAASGDEGATATWCSDFDGVFYPASDPYVIAAGGTTLLLNSSSNYISEQGWTGGPYGCDSNDGGSTGGFSFYWGTPSYQSSFGYGSRAVPDIALNADWYNSPQNFFFEGSLSGNGGTSIVAPEMAGFFAQSNAYLLSLGSVCGSGSSACAPMGDAHRYIYDAGLYGAPHKPFYDITTGCNNNDVTSYYSLGYYCAGTGFDQVTGWGSNNMLQLAWAINWFSAAAYGAPTVTFSGPTTNTWYNTDQTVTWTVNDYSPSYPGTGIAGFTQGWDSIPTDPTSEATPGYGNSFYSGPQFPNTTTGYLDFVGSGVSQGCHTVNVEGWNNMGVPSGDQTYGPICYDTVAPVTSASLTGTKSGSIYISSVKVTLSATDSGSGVAATYYSVDGAAYSTYSAPFTVTATGAHTLLYYSKDKAGNAESAHSLSFSIESPTSTTLTSSLHPSVYGKSVTFTAKVAVSFGSTATGTVAFKNGSTTLATETLSAGQAVYTTTGLGAGTNSITAVYSGSSNDVASTSAVLTETVAQATTTTTLVSSPNPSHYGQLVTFTATITPEFGGTVTGTVTFKEGSVTLGTSTVNSATGKATLTISSFQVGSQVVHAGYSGSTNLVSSYSSNVTQTVSQAATTTTLVSSPNPSNPGQLVTFTATITPAYGGTVTGTVTFKEGSTVLGTATVNSTTGKAVFTTSTLAAGSHVVHAGYSGSAELLTSYSPNITQVVN
jgi:hypothetical protein